MQQLNLPPYEIKIRETDGRRTILDILRRKYVALTPEEWVRQHFVHFLIEQKGYPATLLANEVQLNVGNKLLRADSVLYGSDLHPRMIIEYKAPTVSITQKVFDQISVYNMLLNGIIHPAYGTAVINFKHLTDRYGTNIITHSKITSL